MAARTLMELHPKSGVYRIRKTVPKHLRDVVGKTALIKSLETKNLSEARQRAAAVEVEFNQILLKAENAAGIPFGEQEFAFAQLRGWGLAPSSRDELTLQFVQRLIEYQKYVLKILGSGDSNHQIARAATGGASTELSILIELRLFERMYLQPGFSPSQYDLFELGNGGKARTTAKALKLDTGIEDAPDTEPHLAAILSGAEHVEQPLARDVPHTPNLRVPSRRIPHANGMRVSELHKLWLERNEVRPRTKQDYAFMVKVFTDLHGDMYVHDIERQHVRECITALQKVPKHLPRLIRGLSWRELLNRAEAGKLIGVARSNASVVNRCNALKALFSFAASEIDGMERNPAANMRIKRERRKRISYDSSDLNRLFQSPIYTGCESERKALLPGTFRISGHKFWLPLIALFSGARLEEICQLHLNDLKTEKGVWFFDINSATTDKKLKNEVSHRTVPIHEQLVEMGFKEYVERVKREGHDRLFPDLTLNNDGRYGESFSQWFARKNSQLASEAKIELNGKCFHTFRHTFKDATRRTKMQTEMQDRIMGHRPANVGANYGNGFDIEAVDEAVQSVTYEGLELAHLKAVPTKLSRLQKRLLRNQTR